jgi:hypothetical protein
MTRPIGISELLLAHGFTLLAWVLFVRHEVRVNAAIILGDGAADTLHRGFHLRRTNIRALTAGVLVIVGSLPAWGAWLLTGLTAVALLILLAGYFVRTFNPALNKVRGLDYVARFYVSPSQNAATFPDRYMWNKVKANNPDRTTPVLQYEANELNHRLLNPIFFTCLMLYTSLILISFQLR